MAEETGDASTSASKGIINTILATGISGIILILALLFSTQDLDGILNDDENSTNPATGNAAVNLFILATGDGMGTFLAFLVCLNLFFAGLSSVTVTGRITYALARDGAFPFSSVVAKVHPTNQSPINALIFVCILDSFLQLLPLDEANGSIAFTSVIGLCVIGFQLSYAIPIFLKLIFNPSDFPKTAMDLGVLSKPFAIISCLWLFGTSFLLFLPVEYPVTSQSMNWLVIVFTFFFIVGAVNWIFNSRYYFKGPHRKDSTTENSNITGHEFNLNPITRPPMFSNNKSYVTSVPAYQVNEM